MLILVLRLLSDSVNSTRPEPVTRMTWLCNSRLQTDDLFPLAYRDVVSSETPIEVGKSDVDKQINTGRTLQRLNINKSLAM